MTTSVNRPRDAVLSAVRILEGVSVAADDGVTLTLERRALQRTGNRLDVVVIASVTAWLWAADAGMAIGRAERFAERLRSAAARGRGPARMRVRPGLYDLTRDGSRGLTASIRVPLDWSAVPHIADREDGS